MKDDETVSTPAVVAASGEHRVTADQLGRLRLLNGVMAALHAVSATVLVVLANDFSLPVTTTFWDGPPQPGFDPDRIDDRFDVRLGPAAAGFLYLSALFHLLVATIGFGSYGRQLRRGVNRFRWVEYSFSASLMVVLIAMLTGVTDIGALISLAALVAAMILLGWVMEVANPPGRERTWWTPFVFASIVGAVPWVVIGIYLLGPGGDVPGFVYGIYVTIFVFFNCFAVNQWLQYAGVGPWRRYVVGEQVYVWLSISAKSALAWQVFANTLV